MEINKKVNWKLILSILIIVITSLIFLVLGSVDGWFEKCGNNVCVFSMEDCASCPDDCGYCVRVASKGLGESCKSTLGLDEQGRNYQRIECKEGLGCARSSNGNVCKKR